MKAHYTKRVFSAADDLILRRFYPDTPTAAVAKRLGRSVSTTYQRAYRLGLKKSVAYLASPDAQRLRRGDNIGAAFRYPKGHIPANKGLRRPGWGPGRMKDTQFRKGRPAHEASNYLPIGSERISKDGYLERKVTDDPNVYPARRWVAVHRLLWQETHGPLKPGQSVIFRNGNKADIHIGNLECLSRGALMKRNSVHNLPKPLAQAVQLMGALRRQIRRREQHA